MITGHVASWGIRPPAGTAQINWTHPIASSLVQFIVNGTDLVTNQSLTSFSTGAKTDTNGQGVILAAQTDSATLPRLASSPLNKITTAYTISSLVDIHSLGGVDFETFWSTSYNATWTYPYGFFFRTMVFAGAQQLSTAWPDSSTSYVELLLAYTPTVGRARYTVTRDGATVKFYKNGLYVGAGAATVGAGNEGNAVAWPATARNPTIGNGFPGNSEALANTHHESIGVWSRALTGGEVAQLAVDPYCIVMPR